MKYYLSALAIALTTAYGMEAKNHDYEGLLKMASGAIKTHDNKEILAAIDAVNKKIENIRNAGFDWKKGPPDTTPLKEILDKLRSAYQHPPEAKEAIERAAKEGLTNKLYSEAFNANKGLYEVDPNHPFFTKVIVATNKAAYKEGLNEIQKNPTVKKLLSNIEGIDDVKELFSLQDNLDAEIAALPPASQRFAKIVLGAAISERINKLQEDSYSEPGNSPRGYDGRYDQWEN